MRSLSLAPVVVFCCLAFLAGAGSTARAQPYNLTFSLGYSNVHLQNHSSLFYDHSGPYFDADFAYKVPESALPLLLGVGITGSGYFESQDVDVPLSPTTFATATLYSDVGFFEIEPRAALAFYSGRWRTGFFARPRIGAGLLIDSYSIDQVSQDSFGPFLRTRHHSGAAFEVRPAAQVGYSWGPGEIGLEASYMLAWGDFGNFGSQAQEFRVGPFFTYRF